MTFILTSLENDADQLQLRNADWRPIAEMIATSGLIADDRAAKIQHHLCTPVTLDEAEKISGTLRTAAKNGHGDSEIFIRIAEFAARSGGFEVC